MKHESVEQFKVKTLECGGFVSAFKALHLPFGKESKEEIDSFADAKDKVLKYTTTHNLNTKDLCLVASLINNGDEHAKIIRGIVVWCEIQAPRYWWQEFVTYRIGAECLSSESTMHIQGKGLSTDELVDMKEKLTEGTIQKRIVMISYQTLRRIYNQRVYHRLPQWKIFCAWMRSLPLADVLIFGSKECAKLY